MFDIETLIYSADVDNPTVMARHRYTLDAGAKAHSRQCNFDREEIRPYIVLARRNGKVEALPETEDTRKYRVLKRFYK